ncbi:hypothetical protein HKT18_12470 [Flavobacterium sp. IMCC34852]|uniref:YD repeat-containing protein n=1 Tax=Flavobacterium rivulicola TaxID=2732161 RepID=A0A7Y3RAQ0_9FLAO|nr:hypothetical protein [Flavobacterium sp. IMCC34852]NNT73032.1 hypothetical protein [Flavobacterium sp. IMCC34852]
MRSIGVIVLIIFCSCNPVKIKDFEKDYTQVLVGKVKTMTIKNYEYKFIKKDTTILAKTTVLQFDSHNNIIYEKIVTEFDQNEHNYKYDNGLLVETETVSNSKTSFTTYKYDENKNRIEEKSFDNKRVFALKSLRFDKFKNPIEKRVSYFGKEKGITKIEYDYKNGVLTSKTIVDTFGIEMIGIKHFNKKGYIIRQPLSNLNKNEYFALEIDKKGNLTQKTFYRNDDSVIETATYKNTYDKTGNILVRDRYLNGKLIEKTTYEITYY